MKHEGGRLRRHVRERSTKQTYICILYTNLYSTFQWPTYVWFMNGSIITRDISEVDDPSAYIELLQNQYLWILARATFSKRVRKRKVCNYR